ncbi:uncharacterized protein LAESUDRAFT_730050 [Laetiporus sulphureus 93-53]|uniref:SHSP domain-containing protein n=1 Tax=Laetiporus sulphureus 93-53 TaxID=1314785 RepID=A0A165CC95_9APHY|nr:uncharacterized protein LAESUDRAFT_730050 [Laetiporus sulphureus 93-53]KZT02551.1 hypothetical protein LAESUDRAFT_730050 [Laetiporus sulphureus 93-53]
MPRSSNRPRCSIDTIDSIFGKAFARRESLSSPAELKRPGAPEPPPTPLTPGVQPSEQDPPQPRSPDSLWDEVRQAKERSLSMSPSKVASLERATSSNIHSFEVATSPMREQPSLRRSAKRAPSSATFRESADGRMVIATFDVPGVRKQDMHVTFRTKYIVVSWQTTKTTERREGEMVVLEREENKRSQIIPLPQGATFDEVNALRDGRRLIVTYPNSCCIRVATD